MIDGHMVRFVADHEMVGGTEKYLERFENFEIIKDMDFTVHVKKATIHIFLERITIFLI